MLDIKFIRDNLKLVREAAIKKGVAFDFEKLLALDDRRRHILRELEDKKAEQNKGSKGGPRSPKELEKLKRLKKEIKVLEEELKEVKKEFDELMLQVPNIPTNDTPVGKNAHDNKVIRTFGSKPRFNFKPKEHWELGLALGVLEFEKAGKVSGSRFAYLKGGLALLEFALVQLVFSVLTNEKEIKKAAQKVGLSVSYKPFIPVVPPVFIKPDVMQKMARLEPKEERYYIPSDDLYLVGSAEHTMGPLHIDEILLEKDLPIRYIGFSTSFRREAGSYGLDTKGILRVHQFDKLEMESFSVPEKAIFEQELFVALQERLLQLLGLHYQVVMICTGDMGKPDARQIDIETWMPGQDRYRETHTADYMSDYQARRLNTRVRQSNGKIGFAHMNDATALAIGRTLIAIIENYQTKKGTIIVPEVLKKYMLGVKEIKPNSR